MGTWGSAAPLSLRLSMRLPWTRPFVPEQVALQTADAMFPGLPRGASPPAKTSALFYLGHESGAGSCLLCWRTRSFSLLQRRDAFFIYLFGEGPFASLLRLCRQRCFSFISSINIYKRSGRGASITVLLLFFTFLFPLLT